MKQRHAANDEQEGDGDGRSTAREQKVGGPGAEPRRTAARALESLLLLLEIDRVFRVRATRRAAAGARSFRLLCLVRAGSWGALLPERSYVSHFVANCRHIAQGAPPSGPAH